MDLYHVVLFLHILGAVVLVGMGFFMPVLLRALLRTPTVAGFREWGRATHVIAKMGNPAAVVVLLSGLYMGWAEFSFKEGWLAVSLVLFIIAGGIAGGVLDPALKKLNAAADEAPDGPVSAELRSYAANPKMHNFESIMFGMDLAIVFLMVNKPALVPALIVAAVGFAIGAARIAISSRRHSEPVAA